MQLKVLLPSEVLVDIAVTKVIAEAENGWFCLEPRHVDFVSALVPGLLRYITREGVEMFLGIDEGILVKCGPQVRVSTREAVVGDDPEALKAAMQARGSAHDEHDRYARSVLARLEAGVAKRFLDLQKH
ncbi:MAG: F0F1 ATP synthase subunit epsilon [Methylomonas sp.]|jgi:F-type H+-transporting ATPase subunit epsilon|uniref:F0F1 ATP synthase subunit epsilon n=1 Tax=Methylomonas sp. TaxID=418 RepID=UPI0025FEFE18|nr:F0F1 ATP synthase subunit epsilon [Methylomonas sp.]MCK9607074.1 F0F1 ATP synthase subunit epsilon [Methylomonas sp.]